jgi:hypothetical protein
MLFSLAVLVVPSLQDRPANKEDQRRQYDRAQRHYDRDLADDVWLPGFDRFGRKRSFRIRGRRTITAESAGEAKAPGYKQVFHSVRRFQ